MTQQIKKLFRSNDDRIIAGVAGGLGEYFNVDPLFIRIIFVFLALVHGLGILFYVIFIFIIPKKGQKPLDVSAAGEKIKEFGHEMTEETKAVAEKIEKQGKGWFRDKKKAIGLVVLAVGVLALFNKIVPLAWFRWDIFWRVSLIVVGFYLLVKTNKAKNNN